VLADNKPLGRYTARSGKHGQAGSYCCGI
jgi:hypothetical protein